MRKPAQTSSDVQARAYCQDDYSVYSEEEWGYDEMDERDAISRPALTLDLWGLLQTQPPDEPIATKALKDPEPTSSPEKKHKNNGTEREMDQIDAIEESLLTQVLFAQPRLVRSKSWTQYTSSTERTSTPRRTRSSSLTTGTTTIATSSKPSTLVGPPVRCIQAILPGSVRPCALGPMARASLAIVSSRATVAILWRAGGSAPRVVPLVGCGSTLEESWTLASKMEIKLLLRLSILQDGSWKDYLFFSQALASRENEWVRLLEECLPEKKNDCSHPLQDLIKICENRGLFVGESKDRVALFRMAHDDSWTQVETCDPQQRSEEDYAENVCLVCFDDISDEDMGVSTLIQCGHQVCSDCLKAYLASAVSSGQGSIRCAAFQCPTRMDLFDIAHILFLNTCPPENDSAVIFDKLVQFETEKKGIELCLERGKTRFCPSSSCNRVLVSSSGGRKTFPGSNMLLCACGVSLCADKCQDGGPSHPGITCTDFQKLRKSIESALQDAELENVQWMLKHSCPCPKCRSPIERTGGCNHVRCSACQYYFCWQCGGPGNKCKAFLCENMGKYWHEERGYDEKQHSYVHARLERFRSYRDAETKMTRLRKTLAMTKEGNVSIRHLRSLDLQLTQVSLWMQGSNLIKDAKIPEASVHSLENLEILMHVISLRQVMLIQRGKAANASGFFSSEEVAASMRPGSRANESSRPR